MAGSEQGLSGLWFDGQKYFCAGLSGLHEPGEPAIFQDTIRWLDIYFGGKNPNFTPRLSMKTTPFRRSVWNVMLTIPYGQTMTYGRIAEIIAAQRGISRMSAQAVGNAVAHNAISVIIPCHRVVGNGSLTGYAGGLNRKTELLKLEQADLSAFFVPKKGTAL